MRARRQVTRSVFLTPLIAAAAVFVLTGEHRTDPVGASGTRIVVTLLHEMKRRNLSLGVATACVGGGQGAAIVFERI